MGGGFLWGLSLMLFVFNGGFTKHPQLLARLLRVDAVDKAIL